MINKEFIKTILVFSIISPEKSNSIPLTLSSLLSPLSSAIPPPSKMAEAAVSFLLEQLKEVLIGYRDLIGGAENEFKQLNNDLDLLKAFLRKMAAEKKKKDKLMEVLEKRITKVVYEVEDTIDTCLTNAIIEAQVKAKNSCMPGIRLKTKRLTLASEVKSIREGKVQPLFEDAKKFADMRKIAEGNGGVESPRTESKRDTPIRQIRIVGFEDEEGVISSYLMQDEEWLGVISIIGIPGQGKTTLARMIYENNYIRDHFPIRIWVYVSQVFNYRDAFQQILSKFTPSQDISNLNDEELAQKVRECLEKDRFLLILDDLWSVDSWNRIKEVLPSANGNGKVLITSREMDVGMSSGVYRRLHCLRFLTGDESWRLLQYEVFGDLESCPPELVNIGCHIANKCDGVPLTIVIIGGILKTKLLLAHWEMVAENITAALQLDIASVIKNVVALSFDILPDDLRDCFLYMGVFPEDYEIPVKMLYGLWISEGFAQPRDGRSLEEGAEENLKDLISRNLVKVEKTNHMGKVKTCRVFSMIRAFCIAKSKEDNLYKEISKSGTDSEVQKSHRLCVYSHLSHFLSENPKGPHVRSFMCFYDQPFELGPEYISVIPDGFRKLRILESRSIKFPQFPAKVTKLIHLRYLTLYIDTLASLPEPISQLWNLQTLVVETKSRFITMKANMWKMFRMRHLRTKAAIILDNRWQGDAGQNLQTLNRLSPESCTEVVSKRAINLKTLGICGKLAYVFGTKFLEKLQSLEKLKLVNSLTYEAASLSLPKSNCFPPYLKRLTLVNTFLHWENMSSLAQIKTLEVLKLKDNAFTGVYWDAGGDCFLRLKVLLISNVDLVIWEASSESFPSLRCLVLNNCENVREIPVAFAQTLEKLELERVQASAVASVREIVEKTKPGILLHRSFV